MKSRAELMASLQKLMPATARLENPVTVGGCDLTALAEEHGTPLLIFDEQHLRSRCAQLRSAFPDGVSYASKAFLCLAMAHLVHSEGVGLDVASGGELAVGLRAGVPAERIVFHGNNKSVDELRKGLEAGVGRFVIDSVHEIVRLEALVSQQGYAPPNALVRINPLVQAATHAYVSTGDAASKFGFRLSSGDADDAAARIARSPHLSLAGVHVHVGSQLMDLEAIRGGAAVAASTARRWGVEEISVGGGLGLPYTVDESAPSIEDWAEAVFEAVGAQHFGGRVVAEPGRSLVAAAAVTLYRVGTVKQMEEQATFVSVDGGLSDNPRPAIYGSKYEVFALRQPKLGRRLAQPMLARVVGKNCESGDTLVSDTLLPADLAPGDLLCMPVTGAYSYAMSSNYNKLPRPAVVFAGNGEAQVVVRRETDEDLYRNDALPTRDLSDHLHSDHVSGAPSLSHR